MPFIETKMVEQRGNSRTSTTNGSITDAIKNCNIFSPSNLTEKRENTSSAFDLMKNETRSAAYSAAPRGDVSDGSITDAGENSKKFRH